MESKHRIELESDVVTIEAYRFDEVNPTELLHSFIQREMQRTKKFKDADKEIYQQRIFHLGDITLNANHALEAVIQDADPDKCFITLAKNENDEIIGINFIGLNNNNESVQSFVGVSYDYLYKGIATKLVEDRHDQLRNLGIHSYTAAVKAASRNAIQKQPNTHIEHLKPLGSSGELVKITFA